jgi:RNA polymerase sigma-70 factor (ECF subfamily)
MTLPPKRPLRLEPREARAPLTLDGESSLRDRIAARDEQALSELIALTTPWLLGVAQAMLRDADDAEDVVMDTFRAIWTTVEPTRDEDRGLMPLLLRITRQRAIDRLRSRARRVKLATALTPADFEARAVLPVEPNEAAQPGWHIHSQVHAALGALPADQRAAVQLAYFEGLAQSEIATALGVPLGTVKTRLRLAFGRLRTALAPLKDWVP